MFPEIMISHVGSLTKRIRIGSGGVMLNNHSSLSVAERFSMLEALYPGRIDLGLGRAPGTDGRTAFALRRNWDLVKNDVFAEQLEELIGYFGHNLRADHPFSTIYASPSPTLTPEIFMLGSSTGGVQFALKHGLPFVFAAQLNAPLAVDVLRYYKKNFQPSEFLPAPKSILCIVVITAKTDEEAWKIAEPSILYWVLFMTGKIKFNSSVQTESDNYQYTPQELKIREEVLQKFIVGSPKKVEDQINDWVKATEADEIMVFDMYPDQETRKKGYQLLSEHFRLKL